MKPLRYKLRSAAWHELEKSVTRQLGERLLVLADIRPGMRVIDLAGDNAVLSDLILERIGTAGRVFGAEALAGEAGDCEAALCGFTLAWEQDPDAVLQQVRRKLTRGAPLVAITWSQAERNVWFKLVQEVTDKFVRLPARETRTGALTPLSTLDTLRQAFTLAGLDITYIEEVECCLLRTQAAEEVVNWVRPILGYWVNNLAADRLHAWETALAKAAATCRVEGVIRLQGAVRLVVARPSARHFDFVTTEKS